ncbi:hypothetical protein LINPERPRIM_LOCUS43475 [Linum perenne]
MHWADALRRSPSISVAARSLVRNLED